MQRARCKAVSALFAHICLTVREHHPMSTRLISEGDICIPKRYKYKFRFYCPVIPICSVPREWDTHRSTDFEPTPNSFSQAGHRQRPDTSKSKNKNCSESKS